MPRTTLERITDSEQQLTAACDQIRTQIRELTAQSAETEAALTDLATARKVALDLGQDEPDAPHASQAPARS